MAHSRKTASHRARPSKSSHTPDFSRTVTTPSPGGAVLRDTGFFLDVRPKKTSLGLESEALPLLDSSNLIGQRREKLVRLPEPVLVRLNLRGQDNERISVLCTGEDIGRTGARMMLPCPLGLSRGKKLNMELFLPSAREPLPVRGTIRRISRTSGEDIIRYVVEVEFGDLVTSTAAEIAAFTYESQLRQRRHLPA